MALSGVLVASVVGCKVLGLAGEYKEIRRTSKDSQEGKMLSELGI